MAITIMGGLFVATILTLLVVPALYALWFRVWQDEPQAQAPAEPVTAEHHVQTALPLAAE